MFSGKSTTLFSKIERSLFAGKKVLVITPCIDTRSYFTHGQESTTKDTFKERLLSIAKKAKMKPTIDFIAKWQEKCHIFSVAYELLQIIY